MHTGLASHEALRVNSDSDFLFPFHALIVAYQQEKARTKSKRYSQAVSNLCLTRGARGPENRGPAGDVKPYLLTTKKAGRFLESWYYWDSANNSIKKKFQL